MPLLLAIETSTGRCSVALGDGEMLFERSSDHPRQHHALLLPMIAGLLADAGAERQDIDAIAFGRGPGSFTGLRIAVGMAQGLGFSLARPLVPVSSLRALASEVLEGLLEDSKACVALDAHMGGIFRGDFKKAAGAILALDVESLFDADHFPPTPSGAHLAGDAWSLYPQILPAGVQAPQVVAPSARHVLGLALATPRVEWVAAADAEPFYLRGVNAWKTREQQGR